MHFVIHTLVQVHNKQFDDFIKMQEPLYELNFSRISYDALSFYFILLKVILFASTNWFRKFHYRIELLVCYNSLNHDVQTAFDELVMRVAESSDI